MDRSSPTLADLEGEALAEVLSRDRDPARAGAGSGWWRAPILGIADAGDPLFLAIRSNAWPGHVLPSDVLDAARSVVAVFVPFTPALAHANSRATAGPIASRSWAEAYVATNALLASLAARLAARIEAAGGRAAVRPPTHDFDATALASRWSHKHVAHVAGLGTFGRNHLLITASGCCGRLGSLVTTLKVDPTPRPSGDLCTFRAGGECEACVRSCPVEALASSPFDRRACYDHCLRAAALHADLPLADVCGKCCSAVPCSHAPAGHAPASHNPASHARS